MEKGNNYEGEFSHEVIESLPMRFDSYMTSSLSKIIFDEVRTIWRKKKNNLEDLTGNIEETGAYNPFEDLDIDEEESIEIVLGETPLVLPDIKLAKAILRIEPRKKKVLESNILRGISISDIAKDLGLSARIVSDYKYRALKEIRRMLEEEDSEDDDNG